MEDLLLFLSEIDLLVHRHGALRHDSPLDAAGAAAAAEAKP